MASKEDWKFLAIILIVILVGVFVYERCDMGEPLPEDAEQQYYP